MKMLHAAAGALAVALFAVTGCGAGGGDPLSDDTGGEKEKPAAGEIAVGSADFPESTLLAEIYAGALSAKGVKVTTNLNIGSREAYLTGLQDGSIDLIPEYTGNLLQFYDKKTTASESEEVYAALQKAVPEKLTVLEKSPAEDKDAVVVTSETAKKNQLKTIEDLSPHAKDFVLGGPSEWKERATGVPGLKKIYGLEFKQFRPLKGTQPVQWLKNGQVQAANIFTTDPAIKDNGFVALEDTKNLFPAQNVVPLVNKAKVKPEVEKALNGVSAKLDTAKLTELMSQVVTEKKDPKTVAKDWLDANALS